MASTGSEINSGLQFMMDKYGFSEEELQGIDVEKLINDYQLYSREYTSDEIREILENEGDIYVDDGMTSLYSIFSSEGRTINEDDEIEQIALYINSGTLVQRYIFDLEKGAYYVDDTTRNDLSMSKIDELKQIHKKWNIPEWSQHTEGEEEPSTGNYSWKMVFKLNNGEYAVYDGYTKDMTHLPKHFFEVRDDLLSVVKQG